MWCKRYIFAISGNATRKRKEYIIMIGFLFAVIAGSAMSVQGVMNTRLGDKIGLYESNLIVQGTAFVLSLIALWFWVKVILKK